MKFLLKVIKPILIIMILLVVLMIALFGYQDLPLEELKAKYALDSSSFVSVDGMDVHYRDEGNQSDSIPILLIHGTASSLHTYDDWTDRLRSEYRVVRMDLPGYGLTGPFPDRDYTIDNYVTFIYQFLDKLNIDKCIIAGNSLGGRIAWGFTSEHPEMVDKLILIDAGGYPTKPKSIPLAFRLTQKPIIKNISKFITPRFIVKKSVENVFADKTKVTEALVDRYFELTLREGNRQAMIDRFTTKYDTSAYHKIKLIKQETLILWGEQDQLIPIENAYSFHKDLSNDTLAIIKKAGHVPMEEKPNESIDIVISFLKNKS